MLLPLHAALVCGHRCRTLPPTTDGMQPEGEPALDIRDHGCLVQRSGTGNGGRRGRQPVFQWAVRLHML